MFILNHYTAYEAFSAYVATRQYFPFCHVLNSYRAASDVVHYSEVTEEADAETNVDAHQHALSLSSLS